MAGRDSTHYIEKDWRKKRPAETIYLKDRESFCVYVAEEFLGLMADSRSRSRFFRIIMSGGTTPVGVNSRIVKLANRNNMNWDHTAIFFSDERCVPPDHRDSNFNMIRKTLLAPLKISETHVFRIEGELGPEKAAAKYERDMARFFGEGMVPMFDLALLGMGSDGHTASLFPGNKALKEKERYAVPGGKGPEGYERVTLTYPLLNQSKRIWFLISGEEKRDALSRLIDGPFNPDRCPAQGVHPVEGKLSYILGEGLQ